MVLPHLKPSLPLGALLASALLLSSAAFGAQGGGFDPSWEYEGSSSSQYLGCSVSDAGDVDGDGFSDFIIGAWGTMVNGQSSAGSAYVYSGATGDLLHRFNGATWSDHLGYSVSGAGDVNADGFADLIVGVPSHTGAADRGAAFVYSGATGSLLHQFNGTADGDELGHSVSGAGDVDGDGYSDVIVGAWLASPNGATYAGSAYVYSGATGGLLYQFDGTASSDLLGCSVSSAGDVDDDGFADVIVGAYGADPNNMAKAGSAFVYSGATGSLLHRFDGAAVDDRFGSCVSGAGDTNGDGSADLIIGAYRADPGGISDAGSAYLYSGTDGSLLVQFRGTAVNDYFGESVSDLGDVDRDGFADVLVGARLADPSGIHSAGSAYVYSGATGSQLHRLDGTDPYDYFGISLSGAGDLNGDGFPDVIVGTYADPAGMDSGAARVFSFMPFLMPITNIVSVSTGSLLGLDIDFPDSAASYDYKILISLSGMGLIHYGVDIPLAMDFMVTRSYYGNYPFAYSTNLQGSLDGLGDGFAVIGIPAGAYTGFVGRTIHMAAIANPPGQLPEFSSVAAPITFVP